MSALDDKGKSTLEVRPVDMGEVERDLLKAPSDLVSVPALPEGLEGVEICDDYRGERNKNGRDIAVPDHLYQRVRVIGRECADLNAPTIEIPFTTEARAAFDRICDSQFSGPSQQPGVWT